MAGLSNLSMARIDSALKRANTRIARLEDAFGSKSSTFKNQISLFEKGGLHKYVKQSNPKKAVQGKTGTLKETKSHWQLNRSAIKRDIKSGKLNFDQANEILRNAAGLQIDSSGEVVDSKYQGFQTVSDILKETTKTIQSGAYDLSEYQDENGFIELNKSILKEITEDLNEIAESFQTEYEDSPINSETMQSDPILKNLYRENRGKKSLTYSELSQMANRLSELRKEFDASRLSGKETNDFLSNKMEE